MAGTNSEVFNASQILNSVNQQVDGGRGYQMFYDSWPKLSKSKRRKMAYAAVLQSTAKMANALSTCTQANAQLMETVKKQEDTIQSYEQKHRHCEKNNRERDELVSRLKAQVDQQKPYKATTGLTTDTCGECGKPFGLHNHVLTTKSEELSDIQRKHTMSIKELEREKLHSAQLLKQIEEQQNEYVGLQNQRLESNREQLKVIEYLQSQLHKTNGDVVGLKSEIDALHTDKQNMLNYMGQRLNVAKENTDNWKNMQTSCNEALRTVSDIPNRVNTVQEELCKLQNQLIERQKSDASSNIDPTNELYVQKLSSRSNKACNCNCNNCTAGEYSQCILAHNGVFSGCNFIDEKYNSSFAKDVKTSQPSPPVSSLSHETNLRNIVYADPSISMFDAQNGSCGISSLKCSTDKFTYKPTLSKFTHQPIPSVSFGRSLRSIKGYSPMSLATCRASKSLITDPDSSCLAKDSLSRVSGVNVSPGMSPIYNLYCDRPDQRFQFDQVSMKINDTTTTMRL